MNDENNEPIVIRDMRHKEKFAVDDEYLNGYAKLCGMYATLVYLCLCRHANYHTQRAFPSVKTMSKNLGISEDSVSRGIRALVEWSIIIKERTRHPRTAKWINNSYVLRDKSQWKKKPKESHTANSGMDSHTADSGEATPLIAENHTADSGLKESNSKESNSKDIATRGVAEKSHVINQSIEDMLRLFRVFHIPYERITKNKTERAAALELLSFKSYQWWAEFLPDFSVRMRTDIYCPRATTPHKILSKWGEIEAYASAVRMQAKKVISKGRGFA